MFNWFNERKKTKLYEFDLNECKSIHDKKSVINDKIAEINASGLDDEQKENLIDILENELVLIDNDVRAYGLSMSHHFEGSVIKRLVPIGVDLSAHARYTVEIPKGKGVTDFFGDGGCVIRVDGDKGVCNHLSMGVANKLYEKIAKDDLSSKKRRKIAKIPFSDRVKAKLSERHTKNDLERKTTILENLLSLEGTTDRENRELVILRDIVSSGIDNNDTPDKLITTMRKLDNYEDQLKYDDFYKTFLFEANLHDVFFDVGTITDTNTLQDAYLSMLEETGHFVPLSSSYPVREEIP